MSPLDSLTGETTDRMIVTITDDALAKLIELRDEEADADELGLRVGIASEPGEEFRYDLSFEEFLTAGLHDEVRTHTGDAGSLKSIIPADSIEQLTDATLDYTESQGLIIRNPNKPAPPNIEGLITDDELSAEVEAIVTGDVNPSLAAHGGFVTYVGHDDNGTAYMTMGGGCHGCSMSAATMLDGVQKMLSAQIPAIERVRDLTDHTTGENPYYT